MADAAQDVDALRAELGDLLQQHLGGRKVIDECFEALHTDRMHGRSLREESGAKAARAAADREWLVAEDARTRSVEGELQARLEGLLKDLRALADEEAAQQRDLAAAEEWQHSVTVAPAEQEQLQLQVTLDELEPLELRLEALEEGLIATADREGRGLSLLEQERLHGRELAMDAEESSRLGLERLRSLRDRRHELEADLSTSETQRQQLRRVVEHSTKAAEQGEGRRKVLCRVREALEGDLALCERLRDESENRLQRELDEVCSQADATEELKCFDQAMMILKAHAVNFGDDYHHIGDLSKGVALQEASGIPSLVIWGQAFRRVRSYVEEAQGPQRPGQRWQPAVEKGRRVWKPLPLTLCEPLLSGLQELAVAYDMLPGAHKAALFGSGELAEAAAEVVRNSARLAQLADEAVAVRQRLWWERAAEEERQQQLEELRRQQRELAKYGSARKRRDPTGTLSPSPRRRQGSASLPRPERSSSRRAGSVRSPQ
eukprot:TRINITY_DN11034_c0_g1_i1.p1 TRINITY_DN11034_c0_g1~~TRINITY_DN11034_c0_g1_i1.p1  ORF type:complete len:510 (+),score=229.58 TRINITY_DN11034_c0_g1_i1:60-1532(+)